MSSIHSRTQNLTMASALGDTSSIVFSDYERGTIHVPTGAAAATLTFYASTGEEGEYLPFSDSSGSAVTLAVTAGKAFELPASIAAIDWMKITASSVNANDKWPITLKS